MAFFNRLFGGNDTGNTAAATSKIDWISLDNEGQLEEIKERSQERPQVIFKNSTTCGISRMALGMFTSDYDLEAGQMDLYLLDLLQFRSVSNAVAHEFGITHESPQLIIIKNGDVVFHTSHGAIGDVKLQEYL